MLRILSLGLAPLGFLLPQIARADAPVNGKTYELVSRYSGKCLDVTDHSLAEGGTLQQWKCTGNTNQRFQVAIAADNSLQLRAVESGLTLKIVNADQGNGAALVQSANAGDASSHLLLNATSDGNYALKFQHSGRCLDIDGPSFDNGRRAQQWDCQGVLNQDWRFVEASPRGGDIGWNIENKALSSDEQGRLFVQTLSEKTETSRVQKNTGAILWTHSSDSYEGFYQNCNDGQRTYLVNSSALEVLNIDTGAVAWSAPTEGGGGSLNCEKGNPSVYLGAFTQNGHLRSFARATGAQQWSHQVNGYATYIGTENQNVYLTEYDNNVTTLLALDKSSGSVRWSRVLDTSDYPVVDQGHHLIVIGQGHFKRLRPANGKDLWTYSGNGGDYLGFQSNAQGAIFAQQGNDLRRLSVDDGSTQWQVSLQGENIFPLFLSNGSIFVRTNVADAGSAVLYDANGAQKWSSHDNLGFVSPFEDKVGNVYYRGAGQGKLSLVNLNNGQVQWTFFRDNPLPSETIYGTLSNETDVYVTYGSVAMRYPPMGILRLDAKTGALLWDKWINEAIGLVSLDNYGVFTTRPNGSAGVAFRR